MHWPSRRSLWPCGVSIRGIEVDELETFLKDNERVVDNIRLMLTTYYEMFNPEVTSAQAIWYTIRQIVQIFPECFPKGRMFGSRTLTQSVVEAVMRDLVTRGFEAIAQSKLRN